MARYMHSLILTSGLVTPMFVFNSCIMIPGAYETVAREVIGARADATGKVYEQIVHIENDIYVIVFSVRKGKIVRHRFKHVLLSPPREAKTLTVLYYIEGDANLDWLRVHETDRITRVNTATGEIVPETEASPPFSPVELDWKALQKLEEQPLLWPKTSRPKDIRYVRRPHARAIA